MKLLAWIDSGANVHSKNEIEIDLEELGYSVEDWEALDEEDKFGIVTDYCYGFEWGYRLLKSQDE